MSSIFLSFSPTRLCWIISMFILYFLFSLAFISVMEIFEEILTHPFHLNMLDNEKKCNKKSNNSYTQYFPLLEFQCVVSHFHRFSHWPFHSSLGVFLILMLPFYRVGCEVPSTSWLLSFLRQNQSCLSLRLCQSLYCEACTLYIVTYLVWKLSVLLARF